MNTSSARSPIRRRAGLAAVLAAGGALTVAAVAGCSGTQPTAASSPAPAPSSPAANAPAPTGTAATGGAPVATAPAGAPAATAAHTGGTPECKASGLKLSFGGSSAAMNQQERVLQFTNTGRSTCAIVGFPGVSYVTGDNGQQVAAPATREGSVGAQVNLPPGGVASTVLHTVDAGVFDPNACKVVPVRGYRVYAPDDTASMFIALPAQETACSGTTPENQLSVYTIKLGAGDPDNP